MKNKLLFLVFALLLAFSCNNTSKDKNGEQDNAKAKTSVKKDISDDIEVTRYRPLPKHIYDQIYKYADYLDIIFEDLDISMSQEDNASIRSFLKNINIKRTPAVKSSCKPMGHVVFIKKGKPIIEADFFHSPGCYYFLFFDEMGKPLFANSMSDTGISFFESIKSGKYKKVEK